MKLDDYLCVKYGILEPIFLCCETPEEEAGKGAKVLHFLSSNLCARVVGVFASVFHFAESVTQFGVGCYKGVCVLKSRLAAEESEYEGEVGQAFRSAAIFFGMALVASVVLSLFPKLALECSDDYEVDDGVVQRA